MTIYIMLCRRIPVPKAISNFRLIEILVSNTFFNLFKYSPKDTRQVPRKVWQAGQPAFGWVLQIVLNYKKRTGT